MAAKGTVLASRILIELEALSKVVERVETAWRRAGSTGDNMYIDSVALNLHGFYSGIERIFERIGLSIDDEIPVDANWHYELLKQMSLEIPSIRPAVILEKMKEKLEPYRGFRHVVRNVYTYEINPDKIRPLAKSMRSVFNMIQKN